MLGGLKGSPAIEKVKALIREKVPYAEKDRVFADDIEAIVQLIRRNEITGTLFAEVGQLEW